MEDNSYEILRLAKELNDIIEHHNDYRCSTSGKKLADEYVRAYRKLNNLIKNHKLDGEEV